MVQSFTGQIILIQRLETMMFAGFIRSAPRFAVLIFMSCSPVASSSQTRATVSTSAELYVALSQAKGGETILLAGGNYGDFKLLSKSGFNYRFPTNVTMRSSDPDDPAVFNSVDVRSGANITFDGILFDYVFQPNTPIYVKPFHFTDCDNITIRNSVFDGDLAQGVSAGDDGLGYGMGLVMGSSQGSTVENNEFFNFFRGIAMGSGSDARIVGNDIHDLRMDGMNFSEMQGIVIEDNYVHNFKRSKLKSDHADMIQFWTNNTDKPSTDILIRGNVLTSAKGDSTQTIFMRNDQVDRGLRGDEMFYRNVTIEQNVIVNGHTHGILLGESENVRIRNNTLLRNQASAIGQNRTRQVKIPSIKLASASREVVISGNLSASFPKNQPNWTVENNMTIQDISIMQPGYYHQIFKDAITGDPGNLDNFSVLPGGPADRPGLGADLLRPGADRARYSR